MIFFLVCCLLMQVGSWSNGDLFGQYAYISEEHQVRMFGRVGVVGLDGFQVIKVISNQHHKQQYSATVNNSNANINYNSDSQSASLTNMTFYANFKNNQIIGNFVILMNENIYLCNSLSMNVSNIDQSLQILQKTRNTSKSTLPQTLKKCFPYIKTFQIFEFIQQLLETSTSTTPQLSKYYPRHYKHESKGIYGKQNEQQQQEEKRNYKFYGYSTLTHHHNKCKKYQCGIIVVDDQIVCMGEFVDGRLQGFGKYYGDMWVADGEWVGGMMEGVGVKKIGRKWVYGVFRGGNNQIIQIFEEGTGWPKNIVKKMKSSLHMKSIHFDADFSQVRLTIPWEQLSRIAMSIKKIEKQSQKQKQQKIQNSTRIPHSFFHQNPVAAQQNHPPSRISIFSPSPSSAQKTQIKNSQIQDRNYYTQNNRNFKTQSNQRNNEIIYHEGWKKQRHYGNSNVNKFINDDPQLHITEMKEFQELLSRYADQGTSKNNDDVGKWGKQIEGLKIRGQDGRRVWGRSEASKQGRFGVKKQVDVSQFSLQQLTRAEQKEYKTLNDEKRTRNSYQQPKPQRTRQTRANTIYEIINQHR